MHQSQYPFRPYSAHPPDVCALLVRWTCNARHRHWANLTLTLWCACTQDAPGNHPVTPAASSPQVTADAPLPQVPGAGEDRFSMAKSNGNAPAQEAREEKNLSQILRRKEIRNSMDSLKRALEADASKVSPISSQELLASANMLRNDEEILVAVISHISDLRHLRSQTDQIYSTWPSPQYEMAISAIPLESSSGERCQPTPQSYLSSRAHWLTFVI